MIAQLKVNEPPLELIHSQDIDDLTYDDLYDLQRGIQELFKMRDRGDDVAVQVEKIQRTVKDLAIGFGIIPEVFAKQDEVLARSGMKTQVVLAQ